jgi:ubiquinone/menaquinone biosynthesis C-methylase UbiE
MPTAHSIAAFWDAAADTFDDHADHGLRDPHVKEAWAARLGSWIPNPPGDVLDLGCGTGSLTLLLAQHGHRVVGVDLSPNMAECARRKIAAAGLDARVVVGDATAPPSLGHSFDAVLARHLLWTLPNPTAALHRWAGLPRKGGRLVLVEGRWDSQTRDNTYVEGQDALPWMGGVNATTLAETLQPLVSELRVEPLTDPGLWGRAVNDERYAIVATI